MLEVKAAGTAPGTSVEIRQLFANLPARRKFLRTEETEAAHIQHYLTLAALAFPEVAFTFQKDGRSVWQLPMLKSGNDPAARLASLRERLRALYGAEAEVQTAQSRVHSPESTVHGPRSLPEEEKTSESTTQPAQSALPNFPAGLRPLPSGPGSRPVVQPALRMGFGSPPGPQAASVETSVSPPRGSETVAGYQSPAPHPPSPIARDVTD